MFTHAATQYMLLFFSTGEKFRPVSNITELHALTQEAFLCSLDNRHRAFGSVSVVPAKQLMKVPLYVMSALH